MNKPSMYLLAGLLALSCTDEEKNVLPSLRTVQVESIAVHEVIVTSELMNEATHPVEDHGFVYDTEPIASVAQGSKISMGSLAAPEEFSHQLTELEAVQQYFVRAYASTEDTTLLGSELSFTTHDVNTWFSFDVEGLSTDISFEFMGQQLATETKGYAGFGIGSSQGGTTIIPLYEYDPTTNTIIEIPDCPAGHDYYTTRFTLGDKLYVISGRDLWRLDLSAKEWTQLNDVPVTLESMDAFSLYGQAWIIGKNDASFKSEMWRYDEVADSWEHVSTMNVSPITPFVRGVMQLDDKVYIIACEVNNLPQLYVYEPLMDKYTELNAPPVEIPQSGSIISTYALSAADYGYFVNMENKKIWRYDAGQDAWLQIETPSATAVNAFILNDEIYITSNGLYRYVPE